MEGSRHRRPHPAGPRTFLDPRRRPTADCFAFRSARGRRHPGTATAYSAWPRSSGSVLHHWAPLIWAAPPFMPDARRLLRCLDHRCNWPHRTRRRRRPIDGRRRVSAARPQPRVALLLVPVTSPNWPPPTQHRNRQASTDRRLPVLVDRLAPRLPATRSTSAGGNLLGVFEAPGDRLWRRDGPSRAAFASQGGASPALTPFPATSRPYPEPPLSRQRGTQCQIWTWARPLQ